METFESEYLAVIKTEECDDEQNKVSFNTLLAEMKTFESGFCYSLNEKKIKLIVYSIVENTGNICTCVKIVFKNE